jgi:hypothetical protein
MPPLTRALWCIFCSSVSWYKVLELNLPNQQQPSDISVVLSVVLLLVPCRLYPGLLQQAASAHIATAVTQERVLAAETALSLLRACPTTCEALLLKGVAHVLLGDFQAAAAAIRASAR